MKSSLKVLRIILFCLIIVIAIMIGITAGRFTSLMSTKEIRYESPNRSQISYFLEQCELSTLPVESADYLVASESPHKSDSQMALVFSDDVTDWFDGFVTCPEGRSIQLPDNITLNCTAEKLISPFVRAYRVSSQGEIKSALCVSNISAEEIDQLAELSSVS